MENLDLFLGECDELEGGAVRYIQIEEVKRLRSYRERCQRISNMLVPMACKDSGPCLSKER